MASRFGDENWHFNFDLMLLRLRTKEFAIKWRFRNFPTPNRGSFPPGLVSLQFRIKMWEARKLDWAFNIQASSLGRLARQEAGLSPTPPEDPILRGTYRGWVRPPEVNPWSETRS